MIFRIDDLQDIVSYDRSFIYQITVNGYKNISSGCPKLQHLIINDCYTLRDDMIVAVAANCHNIRCISFLYTPNITDVALKALAVHRKLQQIRIEGGWVKGHSLTNYVLWCFAPQVTNQGWIDKQGHPLTQDEFPPKNFNSAHSLMMCSIRSSQGDHCCMSHSHCISTYERLTDTYTCFDWNF